MLVSYQWLKEYLGNDAPTPEKLAELLTFHAFEIDGVEAHGDDTVIDVSVLPNRSSDCLCHRGIAREIASITGIPLVHDPLAREPGLPTIRNIAVTIADQEACPRFTAALIEGVTVGESPQWLKDRLAALGQRSINNIVDATNYVMYAIGQPLHAYDADLFPQVDGQWHFSVRYGQEGEVVSLLAEGGKQEERTVTCTGSELLIVDASTNRPIGLAGVKGGSYAGVHAGTKRIIVEAAHFHPTITRRTARRLGIVIDASKRFENEPSRNLPPYAQHEVATLIAQIAGGTFVGYHDTYLAPTKPPTVAVDPLQVNALLGVSLTVDDMVATLQNAGVSVEDAGGTLLCTGPFERTDLTIPEDFIEEIGRLTGYQHVASVVPEAVPLAEYNQRFAYSEHIRSVLLSAGFSEVITSSFQAEGSIQLANALAADKSFLRASLVPNLTEVLEKNAPFADLLGTPDTRVFEIGTVFARGEEGITERVVVGIAARVRPSGYTSKDDAVLQEALMVIADALHVTTDMLGAVVTQGVAEFDLSALLPSLPVLTAYPSVTAGREVQYRAFSSYPSMSRDIAMWVPEGTAVPAVEAVLNEAAGEWRVRTTHIDTFTKEGRTSLAFRLVFQASDRTLTDEEVNVEMQRVYDAARAKLWEPR